MLERTGEGQFRVGMQLRAIANHAGPTVPNLHERARRVMEDLAAAAGRGVVRLGVLQDLEVSYIEKGLGDRPVPTAFDTATLRRTRPRWAGRCWRSRRRGSSTW
jgi:DNA-binding IclR family transcriptional regulator